MGSPKDITDHQALVRLTAAEQALAQAKDISSIKKIIDIAEAARVYAKVAKVGEKAARHAEEIKLKAQRKAGEVLAKLERGKPGRKKNAYQAGMHLSEYTDALKDAEIAPMAAFRWQKVAAVPESIFCDYLCADKELTTSGLLSEWKSQSKQSHKQAVAEASTPESIRAEVDLSALISTGAKFGCIYADPPWLYGNQSTRAATGNHYSGMTVQEICDLPIASLAAPVSHLHLWTTNGFLFDAKLVMDAWGFEYRSCFVWVKPQMGIGNYWRVSHEFLLLGVKGKQTFLDKGLRSWGEFNRSSHSTKPDKIRQMVELASPGPRLELFGRQTVPGWTVWGNQIDRTLFNQAIVA